MTNEQYSEFCTDLDALYEKHKNSLPGDGGLENILNGIAIVLRRDARNQTHELVKATLEDAAVACEMAAFNYYASWK